MFLYDQIKQLEKNLFNELNDLLSLYDGDYKKFTKEQKAALGALVNNAESLSVLVAKTVEE